MSTDSQGGELEVTPEEERFLKRFFRRQMLPWFALLLVISITSVWWSGGDAGSGVEARTSAALAQLRTENQRLREEFSGLGQQLEARLARGDGGGDELERRVEDAKQNVRMIEARVTAALERRISALESRAASAPAAPARAAPAAPPPDASAWDVSTILDRLYALEMRQEQEASTRERSERSRASRIAELEARLARLEGGAAPASAAP